MKPFILAFILLPSSFLFALTDAWQVDIREHTAVQRTYKQGESHTLAVSLFDGKKALASPDATARFFWYTNTTQNLWWTNAAIISSSGLVTASWTPSMDTGASSYPFWIGVWTSGSTSPLWRVTGTIRLLPSPGFTPNALPLPVRSMDFAAISVTNAPWALSSDLQAYCTTSALAAAVAPLTNGAALGATAVQPASTNGWTVSPHEAWLSAETDATALAALATNRTAKLWNDDGTQYIDGTGGVWRIEQTTNLDPNRMLFVFSAGATIGGDTPPDGISLALGESVETNGISYYWDANGIGVVRYPSGWARDINVSAPTNIPAIGPGTYGICSNVHAFALEPVPYARVAFVSDLTVPPLSAVVDAGGSATNPVTLTITNTAKYTGLTVTARGADSMGIEAYSRGLAVLGKSTDGNGVSGTALGNGYGVTASGATGLLAVASTTDVGIYSPNKIISSSGFAGPGTGLTGITATQVGAATPADMTNAIAAAQSGNVSVRLTATRLTGYTFSPTNATYFGDCSGGELATQAVVSVAISTNNAYVLAWGCTNTTLTEVAGQYVNYDIFCAENESGDQTVRVEIYRRDVAANTMAEWGDGGPVFTVPSSATPVQVSGSVWVPAVSTNAFRLWARVKRIGGTATSARLLSVGSGRGYGTHFDLSLPSTVAIAAHNADPAAHPAIVFPSLTFSAAGTNAHYVWSFDPSNATFIVNEVLP